ncbi:MAG: hypothetical protein J0J06_00355 [Sphingomonas sp.]|uniref:hypothetical protein n=1 Tax=Sphingomonas sp. TaxID=28214 RepID=UPI001ACC0D64|nr:hypothetical protein [Sphingomonas sp.]MBN8813878.1 hypothetical protein [Sphingomonas sp.]
MSFMKLHAASRVPQAWNAISAILDCRDNTLGSGPPAAERRNLTRFTSSLLAPARMCVTPLIEATAEKVKTLRDCLASRECAARSPGPNPDAMSATAGTMRHQPSSKKLDGDEKGHSGPFFGPRN